MSIILCYEEFNDKDLDDNKDPLRKKFGAIVKDLKERGGTHQGRIKTMSKPNISFPCLRARLSKKGRLLFARTEYNNEDAFIMLEVIPGHKDKNSKRENSKSFRDMCKTGEIKVKEIEVTEGGDIRELSDTDIGKTKDLTVKTKDLEENLQRGHWLGKFITFSAKQEEIVENVDNLPLIVSGSAGSGKTSVALEKLRKIEEEFKEGKILYITQSGNLAKESKKLYGYCDEATGEIPQRVEFLSVHEFLEKVIKEGVEGKKPINRSAFFSWFNKECGKGKFKKYKKDGDKIFEEFTAVIGGGGLLGKDGKDRYVKLGGRQAIFPELERKKIYALFEEYKKFIEGSSEYYDTSLIAHECIEKVQANYDAVVVDEVQDLTESTLGLILKSLKDEAKSNFLLCGDVNQVIHPSFFSISKLKSFLRENAADKEPQVCVLEKNYRNSKQVIELANRILHLKNYCFASEDKMTKQGEKEAFFMKSDTENPGNVGFIAKGEEQKMAKKISGSVDYAVLVLDDESKEDARKLFGTPLVFSIQEAKGLEFENVVLYKFMSHGAYNKMWNVACPGKDEKEVENTIKKIRNSYDEKNVNSSRSKDKEDKFFEEHKFYMNALYVAVTRAINNVYILDDKKQSNLLKVVAPEEKVNEVDTANIKEEGFDPKKWKDMALKLIDNGNIEQARDIAIKLVNMKSIDYAKEIIDALERNEYRAEAQEIKSQLSLGEAKPEQVTKSFSELEFGAGSKSPQKRSGDVVKSVIPTKKVSGNDVRNKADGKTKHGVKRHVDGDNEKVSDQERARGNQNERRNEGVSASKGRHEQKKKQPKLDDDKKLSRIISQDKDLEFKRKVTENPDSVYQYGKENLLGYAIKKKSFKIAGYLIDEGADIDYGKSGATVLYGILFCRVQNKGKTIFQCNLDKENKEKMDVILTIFNFLVEKMKDGEINSQIECEENHTLLHLTAQFGLVQFVDLLLKNGASVNARNDENLTPLHLAEKGGHKDVIDLLQQHGADVNANVDYLEPTFCNRRKKPSKYVSADHLLGDLNIDALGSKALDLIADGFNTVSHVNKLLNDRKHRNRAFEMSLVNRVFFNMVKSVTEEGGEKIDELVKEVDKLLKPGNKDIKPSLFYSPSGGTDKESTVEVALKSNNESIIGTLLRYARGIGANTEIFEKYGYTEEQHENSQPNSNVSNVSVSGNLTQDFKLGGA